MTQKPYLVQCDKRGQIVIPKELRQKLGIVKADFDLFSIKEEGIFLKVRNK
ncbi:MAG TPA: AbrB/MazE/SpoVT family DNA-binding domain-containing protein [Candidatus Nanoarchaeia archaeon]|nr:AbrB/MazE/SpoVT family DNA-binding domain-containing protein [Candidatus Nanoarchaeia archaeon]